MSVGGGLTLYTVYKDPAGYPGKVVVRGAFIGYGTSRFHEQPLFVGDTVDDARVAIQRAAPGAYMIKRCPADEPHVVEAWL